MVVEIDSKLAGDALGNMNVPVKKRRYVITFDSEFKRYI